MASRRRLLWIGLAVIVLSVWVAPSIVDRARAVVRQIRAERVEPFPDAVLRVGINPNNPPFAFFTAEGEIIGFEVDLARALADELGLPLVILPTGFDALYDSLVSGRVDVLIASLQPDNAQTADVTYSQPYFDAGLVLVSAGEYESMRDLSGASLAYAFGGQADETARLWLRRVRPFETMPYETSFYALDAVRLGLADAALVDSVTLELYLNAHPAWRPERHFVTNQPYVVAIRRDRLTTARAIRQSLDAVFDSNYIEILIERWMQGGYTSDHDTYRH